MVALVRAGEGGAGVVLRVREIGGVEVQADAPLLGVVHPLHEFGGGDLPGTVYNFIVGIVLICSLIFFAYLEKRKKMVSRKMAIANMDQ